MINNEGSLTHWGILGMKWGVRRYQNPDGSLTDAGRKRYASDISQNNQKSKKNRVDADDLRDPDRWVKEDISRAKNVSDSSRNMVNALKDIERQSVSKKTNSRMDLSKISDSELREAINREMLEKQYNSLFNNQETSRGREIVKNILEYGGGALAITSSALGIGLAIKELLPSKAVSDIRKDINHDW